MELRKMKERQKMLRQQERVHRQQQMKMEREIKNQQLIEEKEVKRQQIVALKEQVGGFYFGWWRNFQLEELQPPSQSSSLSSFCLENVHSFRDMPELDMCLI